MLCSFVINGLKSEYFFSLYHTVQPLTVLALGKVANYGLHLTVISL